MEDSRQIPARPHPADRLGMNAQLPRECVAFYPLEVFARLGQFAQGGHGRGLLGAAVAPDVQVPIVAAHQGSIAAGQGGAHLEPSAIWRNLRYDSAHSRIVARAFRSPVGVLLLTGSRLKSRHDFARSRAAAIHFSLRCMTFIACSSFMLSALQPSVSLPAPVARTARTASPSALAPAGSRAASCRPPTPAGS